MRYIFVAGGVMSGVGKGVASASIAKILQVKGFRVSAVKIDPYINVDAGTMNPVEHGEVFVTEDGDETDQDIGTYERFLNTNIYASNYMTTGRVYQTVINKERNLEYNGKCVEVVPHIPDEVIERIKKAGRDSKAEIIIIEVGGTVGEYQNMLFLEALRMMRLREPENVVVVLVSYLPIPKNVGEMKTKPTQYAVRTMNTAGIQPDFILCRAERPVDSVRVKKIGDFCNVLPDHVIAAPDTNNIYEIPLNFEKGDLGNKILKEFGLRPRKGNWKEWTALVDRIQNPSRSVRIGIVGKYFGIGDFILPDVYLSVIEALKHASWNQRCKPVLEWLDAEHYEKEPDRVAELSKFDGIVVPGGFGSRGVEGKIKAIQYVRENKIPYLGLCYGMQLASIEFARHALNLKKAHTTEVDPKTPDPIIHIIPNKEFEKTKRYGGTMRLGAYPCRLDMKSKSYEAYGTTSIHERHRHRYEFNNKYLSLFEKAGMLIAGINPAKKLVEIIELPDHPFFVGTQFHPEFKSRPLSPHPLYQAFIKAAINKK